MRQLFITTLTLLAMTAFGQNKDSIDSNQTIFVTESMPSYPGGFVEMNSFIKENLKYPKDRRNIEGRVYVEFVVNEDGSLSDFKVVKGLAKSFDNSALETVKRMPNWIPAKMDNKSIRTKMVIPIKFD